MMFRVLDMTLARSGTPSVYPQAEAWALSSPYWHHLNSTLAGSMEKDRQRLLGTDLVELFLSII